MAYVRKSYDLPKVPHLADVTGPQECIDFLGQLKAMRERQTWRNDAACRGMDPDIFHPGRGEHEKLEEAKQVCATCSVTVECAEFAIQVEDPGLRVGIYGGLGAGRRRDLAAKQQREGHEHGTSYDRITVTRGSLEGRPD